MQPISGVVSGSVRQPVPVKDECVPEKKAADEKKEGTCICNTDKVDREIEKLKKRKAELEQQIHSETDEGKRKNLEKERAQIERELSQKDNDAYRRRHAVYTYA